MPGMAKDKTQFSCSECGGSSPKWLGKCPHCGAWNTLQEVRAESGGSHRFQSLSGAQPVATLSEIAAIASAFGSSNASSATTTMASRPTSAARFWSASAGPRRAGT